MQDLGHLKKYEKTTEKQFSSQNENTYSLACKINQNKKSLDTYLKDECLHSFSVKSLNTCNILLPILQLTPQILEKYSSALFIVIDFS